MPQWATDAIELALGLGCVAAAWGSWAREMRLLSATLLVAGVAAIAHALSSMAA